MDAAAYIIEMLEMGSRYLEPPQLSIDDLKGIEEEYEELEKEYEPAITGWELV